MLAVRARALLEGRLAPSVDDVIALAPPVLRHRMALTFAARADGVDLDQVIERLCDGDPLMALAPEAAGARSPAFGSDAEQLADRLPPLLVAAERVAATVAQGVHGRRRVGPGETFWQFRRYQPGDRAARSTGASRPGRPQLFVRDHEWEAARERLAVGRLSASMAYRSRSAWPTKQRPRDAAGAGAGVAPDAGRRAGRAAGRGSTPAGGRAGMAGCAKRLVARSASRLSLPPGQQLPRHARLVLIGDFLVPLEALDASACAASPGAASAAICCRCSIRPRGACRSPAASQFEGLEGEGRALIGNAEACASATACASRRTAGLRELCRSRPGRLPARHRHPPEPALLALYTTLSTKGQG